MPDPINGRSVTPRNTAMAVASSALKAQQSRMRIIAENIANAESTANVAGGQPYRRQTPVFQAREVDGATGVVRVTGIRGARPDDEAPAGVAVLASTARPPDGGGAKAKA